MTEEIEREAVCGCKLVRILNEEIPLGKSDTYLKTCDFHKRPKDEAEWEKSLDEFEHYQVTY